MNITKPMEEYFKNRMKRHVERVNKYANVVGYSFPNHDIDKFEKDLYSSYVILTWCSFRKQQIPIEYQNKLKYVMNKHYKSNKHHPEYWDNINDMDEESLIEMCADWCAMSEEYNNSPLEWADDNIDRRWKFNETQTYFIYKTLERMWGKK